MYVQSGGSGALDPGTHKGGTLFGNSLIDVKYNKKLNANYLGGKIKKVSQLLITYCLNNKHMKWVFIHV